MQRLSHPNVIAAKEVPSEINVMAGELPLLAMEYCSKGDLRKVTNKTELKDFVTNLIIILGKKILRQQGKNYKLGSMFDWSFKVKL